MLTCISFSKPLAWSASDDPAFNVDGRSIDGSDQLAAPVAGRLWWCRITSATRLLEEEVVRWSGMRVIDVLVFSR